jgi:hypothetical protein
MAEMADGIRPILDRLDEIENRVIEVEEGEEPVPADPRGWLSAELSDTLTGSRSGRDKTGVRANPREIEARLPQLIEEAVSKRFQSMAGKLQEEIEEQHVRTLETFVKNIQVKLVQRVSALEQNMQQQAEAMHQLREYNQRTEDNLSRLITGVDKLAQELPKRLAAAQQPENPEPATRTVWEAGASGTVKTEVPREGNGRDGSARGRQPARRTGSPKTRNLGPKIFWAVVALGILCSIGFGIYSRSAASSDSAVPAIGKEMQTAAANAAKAASKPAPPPPQDSDTKTKMEAAKQYMDRKEYTTAEDIYKQVVQAEPDNEEAIKGWASALYREDKIEESAAVLDRLPKK